MKGKSTVWRHHNLRQIQEHMFNAERCEQRGLWRRAGHEWMQVIEHCTDDVLVEHAVQQRNYCAQMGAFRSTSIDPRMVAANRCDEPLQDEA
ncbi:PerC family transcriptional regulator [Edwardsiella tarda]|uniref:PerC family transcriptional regulator n=1 Tax=Edwardsiella tarda TaxID=636 RepID=UPI00351CB2FB